MTSKNNPDRLTPVTIAGRSVSSNIKNSFSGTPEKRNSSSVCTNGSKDSRKTRQAFDVNGAEENDGDKVGAVSVVAREISDCAVDDCKEDATVEDVTVVVTGKKNVLRGKVWRSRSGGDYVRYRCIDDGIDYRPGGN